MKYARNLRSKQTGSSFYVMLFVAICIGFVVLTVFKLWAFYVDFYVLKSAIDDLPEVDNFSSLSEAKIKQTLKKQLNVSQAATVPKDKVSVEKYDGGVLVYAEYEVRAPLFYNIDVVMKFEHEQDFTVE